MKPNLAFAAAALGALVAVGAAIPAPDLPADGTAAPEIAAGKWFNYLGKTPSIEGLRGRAVLLEFWATW